jgi:hypothetical protein
VSKTQTSPEEGQARPLLGDSGAEGTWGHTPSWEAKEDLWKGCWLSPLASTARIGGGSGLVLREAGFERT